jgi:hypothetical protein
MHTNNSKIKNNHVGMARHLGSRRRYNHDTVLGLNLGMAMDTGMGK